MMASVSLARRRLLVGASLAVLGCQTPQVTLAQNLTTDCRWPLWIDFRSSFLQDDGRVIDHQAGGITTSEGQVYALFFALVAGDRPRFEQILRWTTDNLSNGDLTAQLMAWKWGKNAQDQWTVLDNNPAADADLWLAYLLFEAARLWNNEAWKAAAHLIAKRIERELVIRIPGIGPALLPGKNGFSERDGTIRVNASYQPFFLLEGLHTHTPEGPWRGLRKTTQRLLAETTPKGIVSDWQIARPNQGFSLNPTACIGSYDAIRVYLWLALTHPDDPARTPLLQKLQGPLLPMRELGLLPEKLNACNAQTQGNAPIGLSFAILPFLTEINDKQLITQEKQRILARGAPPKVYYEASLRLFAMGWLEKRYRFELNGLLALSPDSSCQIQN